MRKLEDTSLAAQAIQDKMNVEFSEKGHTIRWDCLHTLHIIINEADNMENDQIYYYNSDCQRQIVLCEIPQLYKYGTDFDIHGMQAKLRGLAERYKDDEGQYLVSVLTTNDLNSATIKDLSELIYQLGTH